MSQHNASPQGARPQVAESANIFSALIEQTVHRVLAAGTAPVAQRYLRPDGASRFLGIDKVTLAEWRGSGIGPRFRKIGTRVVYAVEDLSAFVESHRLQGGAPVYKEASDG